MDKKVLLISIDGMRPDGLQQCNNPYVKVLEKMCTYTYDSGSMCPSITFPCHFSMAHSVTPDRHGILTNTYVPQVRPVKGIFEKVSESGGKCAMFYGWEPLRDIANPGALTFATYINSYAEESSDTVLTDEAEKIIQKHKPDLAFLYMVETDEKGGHDNGWMSEEYLRRISVAIDNVKRMIEKFGDEYTVIIMADHGGHDRSHGTLMHEDMTVPLFLCGKDFKKGCVIAEKNSLIDIAPTIAEVMGISPDPDWEGRSLINNI
ncbi:MAG: alkaline phosphatase family protein [Clostridia bacterium]|nr:alkaline phosphatase family protein [Clostridia bacterium]